jgi:formylglycine-generating enzyme required for sulfatase activity
MRTAYLARGVTVAAALVLLLAAAPAAHAQSAPVVTNVVATQIAGTYYVSITYDVSDADGDSVTVSVVCSSDNGVSYNLLPVSVTGDVNVAMTPGPGKQIIWNAAADYPGNLWPQVVAKVIANDVPGEMVFVPAGNFTMGSTVRTDEQPVHTVYLNAFYIDKYEVTNAQFKQFIDAGGYTTQAYWSTAGWSTRTSNGWTLPYYWTAGTYHSGPAWPNFPVVGVSWYEAEAYANFAGKRLPTEAEWEKAARGTDQRSYPWGEDIDGSRANYTGSGDPYESSGYSTPVGFYDGRLHPSPLFQTTNSPSPYGAYDMAGNVLEWVADWYQSNYYSVSPSSNPPGPLTGSYRVLRGGGWINSLTDNLRSACRGIIGPPGNRRDDVGFRCARTLP